MEFDDLKSGLEACRSGIFSPSGREEVAPAPEPGGLARRLAIRRPESPLLTLDPDWPHTLSIAFSTNGRFVAASGLQDGICVWEVATGRLAARLPAAKPWRLSIGLRGMWCLPIRFVAGDQYLLIGGRELSIAPVATWKHEPLVDFPVVAIVYERDPGELLVVGPDEDGEFPVEALDLESFSLSARPSVFREDYTTTLFRGESA